MHLEYLQAFLNGLILAFGLILPLGPQNTFVLLNSSAQERYTYSLPATIVASSSDTLLIMIAVFGVSALLFIHNIVKIGLLFFGILFLLYIAYSFWMRDTKNEHEPAITILTTKKQITYTLAVSLLNPYAILDTVGVIGTTSMMYHDMARLIFMSSCIFVSWCWFFSLSVFGRCLNRFSYFNKYLWKISAIIMFSNACLLSFRLLHEIL